MNNNRMICVAVLASLSTLFSCGGVLVEEQNLCRYVNPLQGTNSDVHFSTGNTYPAVALPWGMNFWTPQTGPMGNGWQYTYADTAICGFKQTHQPSPWINDYGCFSIMPMTGEVRHFEKDRESVFSHDNEVATPYYYSVLLERYGIRGEMSPSQRGAIFNFTYPESDRSSILIDCYNKGGYVKVIPSENKIIGCSRFYAPNNKASLPDNFATWFVITVNKPIVSYGTWNGKLRHDDVAEQTGKHVGAYLTFETRDAEKIELKVASSFISLEQAQLNYDREVALPDFEGLKQMAAQEWNRRLGRIAIKGGTEEQLRTFYTALYRTMLFPRGLHEVDETGETVHYSPFLGSVESGPFYTDNGFWDTFRAVHPFFTIMYPELSNGVMQSLVNYYREGGWIPEWASPGYKDCMIGQNSVSLIADAYLKGINDFDVQTLWSGIIKSANQAGPNATGRDGCDYYNDLGYIPYDSGHKESVSKTLEYAYNDWCIWQLGQALGKPETEISVYRKRAENYTNVFDPHTGFVRPKSKCGEWDPTTWPDSWGGAFTEGSAWHWTWSVFHDPAGLIDLMGGDARFVARLDSVFTAAPTFDWSRYKKVIHEMSEMVACNMGQYAHGNQPIQHAIYLYNYAGTPWKAQFRVREVMNKLYRSGIEDGKGLCGDEDNGQTSAWYVFSAMGFYPVCPGSLEYVIGSPLFEKISMNLNNGRSFTIKAHGNSPENVYIQSARLNGQDLNRSYLRHDEICNGGILELVMGAEPNKAWASSVDSRPSSMSNYNILENE